MKSFAFFLLLSIGIALAFPDEKKSKEVESKDLAEENKRVARDGGGAYSSDFGGNDYQLGGSSEFAAGGYQRRDGGGYGGGAGFGGGYGGGLGGGLGGGYGGGAGGGYGGGLARGGGGGGYGGGEVSYGKHYYSKPTVIRVPFHIPVPVHAQKDTHVHHHHKHVHVTPVSNYHKHVRVYPLYQQHKHVNIHPSKTQIIKETKPILIKPEITPIYKPTVWKSGTVRHYNYGLQGRYGSQIADKHVDGGSYGGVADTKHVYEPDVKVDHGTSYSGYGDTSVKVAPAHINKGSYGGGAGGGGYSGESSSGGGGSYAAAAHAADYAAKPSGGYSS